RPVTAPSSVGQSFASIEDAKGFWRKPGMDTFVKVFLDRDTQRRLIKGNRETVAKVHQWIAEEVNKTIKERDPKWDFATARSKYAKGQYDQAR
ncbi:hypothetical protein BGZ65_010702, partial [Modicella reniformis]